MMQYCHDKHATDGPLNEAPSPTKDYVDPRSLIFDDLMRDFLGRTGERQTLSAGAFEVAKFELVEMA